MPAYDFNCPSCDSVFELTRSITDNSRVCCPSCGGPAKRVFTPVGVVFKGSGFHNTDYRKPTDRDAAPTPAKETCAKADGSTSCASCPAANTK